MTMWILSCDKTGRWWRHRTEGMAARAARGLGLTCYTIERDGR